MLITGGDTAAPGTALLIAAAPVGKGRLIDASSVLPALAAVPPSALTGTRAATVVELADPLDPQTVLTRIRAAAASQGPLFLYVAGQLQLDRKQRLPHLALARSTPSTLRYTALPWHWLASELTIRRPDTTTVFVDLVADPETWERVIQDGLALGRAIRIYGRIAPHPGRRGAASPDYLRACASIWRSGARPDPVTLHEQAALHAGVAGALLLTGESWRGSAGVPSAPGLFPPAPGEPGPGGPLIPGVPRPEGTHPAGAGLPGRAPGGPSPAPAGVAPARPVVPELATTAAAPGVRAGGAVSGPPGTAVAASTPDTAVATSTPDTAVARSAPGALRPAPGAATGDTRAARSDTRELRAAPGPATSDTRSAATATAPDPAARTGPRPAPDPHPAILAAAMDGRHTEAAAAAAAWEQQELRVHGPGSAQAIHWLEVRADLARIAREPGLSCALWMSAADARLTRQQATDDPDVEGAVDRAHHQWEQIKDPGTARTLAPRLVALRKRVPGRQRGALRVLQRRLESLHSGHPA
ncbi:hypothetical protein ACWF94_05715 [Streptomyces sp. NPDC055078]